MPTKRQEREELLRRQGGLSAFSGLPIRRGARLETHHEVELFEGGDNTKANKRVMTLEEHLAEHFRRSRDPQRTPEQRQREEDTVNSRLRELTPEEKRIYDKLIRQQVRGDRKRR